MSDAHLTDRGQQHSGGPAEPPRHPDGPEPIELSSEPIRLSRRESDEEPSTGRWSRRKKMVLGAGLAVGLLGAAVLGTLGWRVTSQQDAELAPPAQAAGLTRDDSDRARSTAEYLRSGFAAEIDLEQSFGVVYRDPADEKLSVLLFGGTTLLWQPERDLDRLFELMNDATGTVTGLREVPAGDLGGVMKCGATSGEEGDFTVCGWADHGSTAMAMLPGRSVEPASTVFRQLREAIQTRR